ncbi:hypothetical protein [Streptomyces sp. NPDC058874]|uniref:hypothetical protein n=1 Tax=unclassified Streptomyces TaxID=2593676 RepID=UPI0036C2D84D
MAKYKELTIKLLFGGASTCAYPGCKTELLFRDRDQTTVIVEIAHIRSEKPNGPRHDPMYPKDLLNTFENLLLLCGVHHAPVDRHESSYTVEELLEWKAAQVAQAGTPLSASDSHQVFEQILLRLAELTEIRVSVELRGGRGTSAGMVTGPLASLMETKSTSFNGEKFIVVEVTNGGFVPVEVAAAGLEFCYRGTEGDGVVIPYQFDGQIEPGKPVVNSVSGRLPSHSTRTWFCLSEAAFNGLRELHSRFGTLPGFVRPFVKIVPAEQSPAATDWQLLKVLEPYLLPAPE